MIYPLGLKFFFNRCSFYSREFLFQFKADCLSQFIARVFIKPIDKSFSNPYKTQIDFIPSLFALGALSSLLKRKCVVITVVFNDKLVRR